MTPMQQFDVVRYVRLSVDFAIRGHPASESASSQSPSLRDLPRLLCRSIEIFSGQIIVLAKSE
jgi:hypothetical protein